MTLPVETSHFLKLLSELPVTIHLSVQSSSPSSSSLEFSSPGSVGFEGCRGAGGPQAILNKRHLTLSK
jgi:hypothetical protein